MKEEAKKINERDNMKLLDKENLDNKEIFKLAKNEK